MSLMAETVVLGVEASHEWLQDHLKRVAKLGVESRTCYTVYDLRTSCKCFFHQTDAELTDSDSYTGCVWCCTSFAKDMVFNKYRFTQIRSEEAAHEIAQSYHSMVLFSRDHVVASARLVDYKVQKHYDYFGRENGFEIVPITYMCARATPQTIIESNWWNNPIKSHPIDL